jgi:hypothetical protein
LNRKNRHIACLAGLLFALPVYADQTLIGADGREIRLKDDGTWEYVSNSIFIDTREGQRVELKPDGSWSHVGLAPVQEETQYRELAIEVSVASADIEEYVSKVGATKNTRKESFTNFYLDVTVSGSAESAVNLKQLTVDQFSIVDNKKKNYPVIEINSEKNTLAPGESTRLHLKTKGAPGGLVRTKYINLSIEPQAFRTEQAIELEIDYDALEISRKRR